MVDRVKRFAKVKEHSACDEPIGLAHDVGAQIKISTIRKKIVLELL